jgi:two-component system phosphate regulon response regulator PhoB
MLTAKTTEDNKVQGLELGADDYISKPFAPKELAVRIKAVLRRSGVIQGDEVLEVAGLKIDHGSHRVTIDGVNIDIGPTEYKLLSFFMNHQDRVYSRSQLLDHVWGNNAYIEERTIDVHIRRLRKALKCKAINKDYGAYVQTVRCAGYRFSTLI